MTIAYADLMAHLGRYEAAVTSLQDWINNQEKETSSSSAWLLVRARIALVLFTEEWIRRLRAPPGSLRDIHIGDIKTLIADLETIQFSIETIEQALPRNKEHKLDETEFRNIPREIGRCPFNDPELSRLVSYYLNAKVLLASNIVEAPEERWRKDGRLAASLVLKVINSDLTCLQPDERPVTRGDALDFYARILIREANELVDRQDGVAALKLLKRAQAAAKLGRLLVTDAYDADIRERSAKRRFLDKIVPTPSTDTFEELGRRLREIDQAIKRAEQA